MSESAISTQEPSTRRLALWVLIAAAFSALIIQYSYTHGKLLCPPWYDDVSYFEDGLHRLHLFYREGIGAVLKDYVRFPPHSPFSSALAVGAFALMGVHDWAPYVANGLIIVGLLAFLDYLTRDLILVRRLALFLVVLTVPICGEAVYEFRPDIASSLCAAIGATMLIGRPPTASDWRYRVVAGGMFGLAMLFKPPTFPLTLIVFASAVGVSVAIEAIRYRPPGRAIAIAAAQCATVALLVPLPHFLISWGETLNYIYEPIFGPGHAIWARQMSLEENLKYYLTGEGGQLMLGLSLWWLLGVVAAGLIGLLALGRWEQAARLGGLLCVCAVAYAVPTKMDVKQAFFGTTFDWLLVFAAVFVLCIWLRARGWLAAVLVVLVLFFSLREARFRPAQNHRGSAVVRERNQVLEDIYGALLAEHFPFYRRVYITSTGYINAGVLDYYYRRDTLHALNIGEYPYSDNLKDHERGISLADYVVASESDNGLAMADFLCSGLVQDQTLALVRKNPDFQQIDTFQTRNGKHYFLFKRIRNFCGWSSCTGLAETNTSRTYLATSRSTSLTIPPGGNETLRLVAGGRSTGPVTVRILADGKQIGAWTIPHSGDVDEFGLPFALHGGGTHKIELVYEQPDERAGAGAITFTRLQIIPDDLK
jgi:hypothetical protein